MNLKILAATLGISLLSLNGIPGSAASAPAGSKGATSAKSPSAPSASEKTAAPVVVETAPAAKSAALSELVKAYKSQPDSESWDRVFTEIYNLLGQNPKASAGAILSANPALTDVGARCTESAGVRIWTFTKIPDNQAAVVLWQNVSAGPDQTVVVRGRKRIVHGEPSVSWKGQMLRLPSGLCLKDAKLVRSSVSATPPAGAAVKKTAAVEYVRALILSGIEKNGNTWLHAYRLGGTTWTESPDVFSGVPPFLLQNLSGKVTFNCNDLIVSVGNPTPASKLAEDNGKALNGAGTVNGYRLVLHFINGKYVLDGKTAEDGPFAVAQQFASAVAQNRVELAKGWMAEGKLIAIPQYAGVLGHSPLRVMPMANPGNGNSRFRLVSFLKDDLIIDIGKIKTQQLAVKAIYVAPADPLAQKLLGTLGSPASSTSTTADEPATEAK